MHDKKSLIFYVLRLEDHVKPGNLVQALCDGLWGGAPEARAIADIFDSFVTAETSSGSYM